MVSNAQNDTSPTLTRRRPSDLRARHLRPAVRPARHHPVRRARGRVARRGGHRAGGQAPPSGARLLRAGRAADARRPARRRTAASTSRSRQRASAARCASSSTTPTRRCCRPDSGWATTTPASSPWRRTSPPRATTSRVVSKDLPMRVKASAVGMRAEEYRAELAVDSGWTGMAELDRRAADGEPVGARASARRRRADCDVEDLATCPCHTGLVLLSRPRQSRSAASRRTSSVRLVRGDREVFGLHGRSAEQRIAIDLLLDEDDRHRLDRRPRRHRQVGARAVRRSRGRAGAPPAPARSWCSGRSTRWAARSSATCPARGREDEPLGPGGLRHPRRDGHSEVVEEVSTAGCSRCCR